MFSIHRNPRTQEYLIYRENGHGREYYHCDPDLGIQRWGQRGEGTHFDEKRVFGTFTALVIDNEHRYDYGVSLV